MSYITSVTDYKGTFKPSSEGTLVLKITEFDGIAKDPSSITVDITGPGSGGAAVISGGLPFQASTGYYVYVWDIDASQGVGSYTVTWTYVVDGDTRTEVQTIAVADETAFEGSAYSVRVVAFRAGLESHIKSIQNLPVYSEPAKVSRDNSKFYFTFPRWNQSAGVRIYRNEEIVNSGVQVDYFNGNVIFADDLLPGVEVVSADYNFRWFSQQDLDRFLDNALLQLNFAPPSAAYNLNNAPDDHIPAILYGAARDAIRSLMMSILTQEPAQVFGGIEAAKAMFSNLETLKQDYEKDFLYFLENKKYGPYPNSRGIVSPTYTLPGGRSLDPDTRIIVDLSLKNEVFYEDEKTKYIQHRSNVYTVTIKELYKMFHSGHKIKVLSQDDSTGKIVFSPINYVWDSGIKDVYEIETENDLSVRSSLEHNFYVNGRYLSLEQMKKGDSLITYSDNKYEQSTVKSIKKLQNRSRLYDLEVEGTANLFADGIKSHNSRWFRQLFKG